MTPDHLSTTPEGAGMVGRVYTWQGGYWRVRTRWQGRGPRNVLIERVEPCYRDDDCAMYACPCRNTGWRATGEWTIRPFRGLRRLREDVS